MPPATDERAEQLRRQRANAEPHGQNERDPRQDIAGASDKARRVAQELRSTRSESAQSTVLAGLG